MPKPHFQDIIAGLSFEKKLIAIGTILMVISLFLPWYQDLDSFRTGDTFTGLTGPLYIAGFTFLIIASFSIFLLVTDYFDKKVPLFRVKASKFFLPAGIFSFYLLILVNSVYFDKSFGINITLKQSQFGMFIAFVGAALLTIGGYLLSRERSIIMKDFQDEANATITQMPTMEQVKPRESLRTMQPPASGGPSQKLPSQEKSTVQPFRMDL